MSKNKNKKYFNEKPETTEEVTTPVAEETEEFVPVEEEMEEVCEIKDGEVICALLNLRKEPGSNTDIVDVLPEGSIVSIVGEEGDFYKVETMMGDGYVMKKFVNVK